MNEDDFCQQGMELLGLRLTCDQLKGHDGRHGGIYPGHPFPGDGTRIYVEVQW